MQLLNNIMGMSQYILEYSIIIFCIFILNKRCAFTKRDYFFCWTIFIINSLWILGRGFAKDPSNIYIFENYTSMTLFNIADIIMLIGCLVYLISVMKKWDPPL